MSEDTTPHKCCRLVYLLSREKIEAVFKVHGDIDYWDNPGENEPPHGWLMKELTIPCNQLTPDGCRFDLEGKQKPERCRNFPTSTEELYLINTCSYSFKDGVRTGKCSGCIE